MHTSMSHTSHVRVTLDLYVCDDYQMPDDDSEWAELLGLEGNESVEAEVKTIDEASKIYEEAWPGMGW
jgi:hypothetical protein